MALPQGAHRWSGSVSFVQTAGQMRVSQEKKRETDL